MAMGSLMGSKIADFIDFMALVTQLRQEVYNYPPIDRM